MVSGAIGVALLVILLRHTDLEPVADRLDELKWQSPLILLPYLCVTIVDALAWRWSLSAPMRLRVPFVTFFFARLAGEAVNSVTPTATLGGEPVKAHLLRAYDVPISDGLASIVVAKTALTIAQSLFTAVGFVGLLMLLGHPGLGTVAFLAMVSVLVGFTYVMLYVQQRNPATAVVRALARFLPRARFVARLRAGAYAIDQSLADFYRVEQRAFARATLLNLAGWLFGIIEVQLIVTLAGNPVTWLEAFVIEAVAQPIRAVSIVIPGGIGAQEWGGAAFCEYLGMPEDVAIALWLLKRGRETFFDASGLLYLGWRTAVKRDA